MGSVACFAAGGLSAMETGRQIVQRCDPLLFGDRWLGSVETISNEIQRSPLAPPIPDQLFIVQIQIETDAFWMLQQAQGTTAVS